MQYILIFLREINLKPKKRNFNRVAMYQKSGFGNVLEEYYTNYLLNYTGYDLALFWHVDINILQLVPKYSYWLLCTLLNVYLLKITANF